MPATALSSVKLFNKLKWLPFYEQAKIAKCSIVYKRLQGNVPAYLKTFLKLSSETHSRETRYANFNVACPIVKRQKEGGRTLQRQHLKRGTPCHYQLENWPP